MPDRSGSLNDMPEAGKAILNAAREIIAERGEDALRVTEVADHAGVAVGLLYHYFKDRVDLIAAVRESQFRARLDADISQLGELVSPRRGGGVLRTIINDFADPYHPERMEYRMDRAQALAAARHNPDLMNRLAEAQAVMAENINRIVDEAKANGILDPTLDTKAMGFFLEVIPLGLLLANVYGDYAPDPKEWEKLLFRMLKSLAPPSGK
jgi:AcrR family transcriptional regulator